MPENKEGFQGSSVTLFLCARHFSFSINQERIKRVLEISDSVTGDILVLGLNSSEQSKLEKKRPGFSFEIDLENNGFLEGVNEAAVRLASTWYQAPILKKYLSFRAVNLGEIIQHSMTYFLLGILRDIAYLDSLVATKRVSQCFFFDGETVVEIPRSNLSVENLLRLWKKDEPLAATDRGLTRKETVKESMLAFMWWIARGWIRLVTSTRKTKTILFSSDFKHIKPILESLIKRPLYRLICLRRENDGRHLPYFLKRKIAFYAYRENKKFLDANSSWKVFSAAIEEAKLFSYRSVSFWSYIKENFKSKFFVNFQALQDEVAYFYRFLTREMVQGIVVDEDTCPFNKCLILVANQLSIPSLVIQHGAPFWAVPIALSPVTSSKIAAWGEYSRQLLLEWGVPSNKIEVTGVPRYDHLKKTTVTDSEMREMVQRDLKLDVNKKIIILATDPFHEPEMADFVGIYLTQGELKDLVQMAIQAISSFSNMQLVIKLHPRDRYENFTKNWVKEARAEDRMRVVRTYSTPNLLQACDCLLTVCSTVAIEALLANKPVISINTRGGRDLQPHVENGVSLGVGNLEELKVAIKSIFTDKSVCQQLARKCKEVIPSYIFSQDGNSSERIVNLLLNLMKTKNPNKKL